MTALAERQPAFVERRLHNGRAEPRNRVELRGRRGVHDEHAAWHAGMARGERHALRGVAGAHGPHAAAALGGGQHADGVPRAANLEDADRLQVLQLQVDLPLVVESEAG